MLEHKLSRFVKNSVLICIFGYFSSGWAQESLKSNEGAYSCRPKLVRFNEQVEMPHQVASFRALFHLDGCKSDIRIDGDMSAFGHFEIHVLQLLLESKAGNNGWQHEQDFAGNAAAPTASVIIKSRGQGWLWSPPFIFEAGKTYRVRIKANGGSVELVSQPFHFVN
jgi:hypothetical protein